MISAAFSGFTAPQNVELQNGEVLVALKGALLSAEQADILKNGNELSGVLGAIGEVIEVGSGITNITPNTDITFAVSAGCGSCQSCQSGQEPFCPDYENNSIRCLSGNCALLSRQVVQHNTRVVPPDWELYRASALNLVAEAIHALGKIQVRPHDDIAILGCGGRGLLFVQMLRRLYKVGKIIAADSDAQLRQRALNLGADYAVPLDKEQLKTITKNCTDNYGVQAVIDTTGMTSAWDTMAEVVSKGSNLLFCGDQDSDYDLRVDATQLHYNQLRIVGAHGSNQTDVAQAWSFLENNSLDIAAIISSHIYL